MIPNREVADNEAKTREDVAEYHLIVENRPSLMQRREENRKKCDFFWRASPFRTTLLNTANYPYDRPYDTQFGWQQQPVVWQHKPVTPVTATNTALALCIIFAIISTSPEREGEARKGLDLANSYISGPRKLRREDKYDRKQ